MTKQQVCERIEEIGIIPAVRVAQAEDALFAADSVSAHGIPIAEITVTAPGAMEVIARLVRRDPAIIVGAGSVDDMETAARAVDAGARFLTTTGLDLEIVRFAVERNICVFPGVLTPTEVMAAWKAGPDFVKLFPCALAGGPAYIKALRPPFPGIRFIASGGVNQQTAAEFILAGAAALGIGSALIPHEAIHRRQEHWIGELARRFLHMVKKARNLKSPSEKQAHS